MVEYFKNTYQELRLFSESRFVRLLILLIEKPLNIFCLFVCFIMDLKKFEEELKLTASTCKIFIQTEVLCFQS